VICLISKDDTLTNKVVKQFPADLDLAMLMMRASSSYEAVRFMLRMGLSS
jgi:hypothetical protein